MKNIIKGIIIFLLLPGAVFSMEWIPDRTKTEAETELVDPKIVIKIYNISTLHKNMYVLKYSILNSFAQNPAISTLFLKGSFR